MQATRIARFTFTQVALGGRQPYGMKPSRTRRLNERERKNEAQHTRHILRKYIPPSQWSGLDIPAHPYYPEELIPQGKEPQVQ